MTGKNLFLILDRLDCMDSKDLLDEFTDKTIAALRVVGGELNEKLILERVLSENRFVEVVRELVETRRIWSRHFDETVNLARKAAREGKVDQARWIIDGFLRFCPSPYFRGLAVKVIDEVGLGGRQGSGNE